MKNFVIIVLICIFLFYITQKSPAYGFFAMITMSMLFINFTIQQVTDADVKYRNQMISKPDSRFKYYQDINSGS